MRGPGRHQAVATHPRSLLTLSETCRRTRSSNAYLREKQPRTDREPGHLHAGATPLLSLWTRLHTYRQTRSSNDYKCDKQSRRLRQPGDIHVDAPEERRAFQPLKSSGFSNRQCKCLRRLTWLATLVEVGDLQQRLAAQPRQVLAWLLRLCTRQLLNPPSWLDLAVGSLMAPLDRPQASATRSQGDLRLQFNNPFMQQRHDHGML